MADIVLATLNARYSHASFGLRYLMANMGDLQPRARMLEFDLRADVEHVVSSILSERPSVVGLGIYIWNAIRFIEVVRSLRARDPDVIIVLGGPEVSHEVEQQEICALADYVVTDEGDLAFPALCRELLAGRRPASRLVPGGFVDVQRLALPYDLYSNRDIAERVIYVEASRGCPFTCEFCLSSLNVPVRRFDLNRLIPEFQRLLDRGVRHFKFVDRTFNLSIAYSLRLLDYFLEHYCEGLFLHFEMIPDRLPGELAERLLRYPRGSLQFEVGIQTFNEEVAARIRRRQDYTATEENLRWLLTHTGAHLHADLIIGLPGETLESFAMGFDRLVDIGPHEIQSNVLKRLRGTPLVRHDAAFGMRYRAQPPYELIENRDLDAAIVQRLQRFARFWDIYVNSGNFVHSAPMLWRGRSPFLCFMEFVDTLYARHGRTHALALDTLAESLFDQLCRAPNSDTSSVARLIWQDVSVAGNRDMPLFLRPYLPNERIRGLSPTKGKIRTRQARRLAGGSDK